MGSEQENGLFKFLITLIILNILFISYSIFIGVYSNRDKLEYKTYSSYEACILYNYIDNYQKSTPCKCLSNEEIKSEIQKIIKPNFYIEIYTNKSGGRTYSSLRIIGINKNMKGCNYAYTLIHEYIHLNYMLADESLVDFLSVKLLWESNVPFLQKAACYTIKSKILYDNGSEYDCTAQLIEYFRINEGIYG